MNVIDFIGVKAQYDEDGAFIWGVDKDGGFQKIIDLRGFGAIQNLFKNKSGIVDYDKSVKFQDDLGKWIELAINEKLERERELAQTGT